MGISERELIPVSANTKDSLNIVAFEPNGIIRFMDDRWLKVYMVSGTLDGLADVLKRIAGRTRVTVCIGEDGRTTCHLAIMEVGNDFEQVYQRFENDEWIIGKVCCIRPLSLNGVMNQIAAYNGKDANFSYASFVRGQRDWKSCCWNEPVCDVTEFFIDDLVGEALYALEFLKDMKYGLYGNLVEIGCPMIISIDLGFMKSNEQQDFMRALEKKYNRRLSDDNGEYFNMAISVMLLCDSKDAKDIVEETVISVFLKYGIVLSSCFRSQKEMYESILSLGIIDKKLIRTASVDTVKMIMGGIGVCQSQSMIRQS